MISSNNKSTASFDLESLITLVKDNPPIYDASDRQHNNRELMQAIWRNIAHQLNCKEFECKEKWHHLRSNYMRERRRITVHTPDGVDVQKKQHKWPYYEAMLFLEPHVSPRVKAPQEISTDNIETIYVDESGSSQHSQIIVPDVCEIKFENDHETVFRSAEGAPENKPNISILDKSKVPNKRRRTRTKDVEMHFSNGDYKNLEEGDPDHMFLLSILPLMRQLTPVDNMNIRIEILEAIRTKLYSGGSSDKSANNNNSTQKM